jgi:hypothetical protein
MKRTRKIIAYALLGLIAAAVAASVFFYSRYEPAGAKEWGLTFSHSHARYLGFDWKVAYLDILNDLQPKHLRLMAYWEDIEPEPEKYNFEIAAQMIAEAQKRGISVILVLGHKQPRWPECHHPAWYNDLSDGQKTEAQLRMVENAVNYYKQFTAIKAWQVENEALFTFGDDCPRTPRDLVLREMAIVRAADDRPIILSDSGEFGRWVPTMNMEPDIFGSTMYRVVHNPKVGHFKYPLPPQFFKVKAGLAQTLAGKQDIIGVELQAEPWFHDDISRVSLETQYALMNPKIFREYSDYAKEVGFRENYLWGVEWWYWLAQKQGDWGMWDEARRLLSEN